MADLMTRDDDNDDRGAAPAAVEMDARLGLLVHALNTHTACGPVVSYAAREIADAWRRSSQRQLADAIEGTAAVSSLWCAISLHATSKEVIVEALRLVLALVESQNAESLNGAITIRELLASTAAAMRVAVVQKDVELLCLFNATVLRLLPVDTSASADELSTLTEHITGVMIRLHDDSQVIVDCFRVLFQVTTVAPMDWPLGAAAVNVITKTLKNAIARDPLLDPHAREIATAAIPVITSLCRDEEKRLVPTHLLVSLMPELAASRELNDTDIYQLESFIDERLSRILADAIDTLDGAKMIGGGLTNSHILPLPVLWRNYARQFVERDGCSRALAFLEGAVEQKHHDQISLATSMIKNVLISYPTEATSMLQPHIADLLQYSRIVFEIESDDTISNITAVLLELARAGERLHFLDSPAFPIILHTAVKRNLEIPKAMRRVVQLIAELPAAKNGSRMHAAMNSSIVHDLIRPKGFLLTLSSELQKSLFRALVVLLSWCNSSAINRSLDKATVKDIVRVMRMNITAGSVLEDVCDFLMLVMPSCRHDLIDNGIVQVVAKAMYIHRGGLSRHLNKSLEAIMSATSQKVDLSRNLNILQSLVNLWRHSVSSTSEMDSFVDSLELCAFVLSAFGRIRGCISVLLDGGVFRLTATILLCTKEDFVHLSSGTVQRILGSIAHLLSTIIRGLQIRSHKGDDTTDLADSERGSKIYEELQGVLLNIVALTSQCLNIHGTGFSGIGDACNVVVLALQRFQWASEFVVNAGWIDVSLDILHSSVDAAVLEPTLSAIISVMGNVRSSRKQMVKNNGLVSLARLLRSSVRSANTNQRITLLTLRVLECTVPQESELEFDIAVCCLDSIMAVLDVFGISIHSHDTVAVARSVTRCICSPNFLTWLVVQVKEVLSERAWAVDVNYQERSLSILRAAQLVSHLDQRDCSVWSFQHRCELRRMLSEAMMSQMMNSLAFVQDLVCLSRHLFPIDARFGILENSFQSCTSRTQSFLWLHDTEDSDVLRCADLVIDCVVSLAEGAEVKSLLQVTRVIAFMVKSSEVMKTRLLEKRNSAALWAVQRTIYRLGATGDRECEAVALILLSALLSECSLGSTISGVDPSACTEMCLGTVASHICNGVSAEQFTLLHAEVFESAATVLPICIAAGGDYARVVLRSPVTRWLVQVLASHMVSVRPLLLRLFWGILEALLRHHGVIFGEMLLRFVDDPAWTVYEVVYANVINKSSVPWRPLIDCLVLVEDSCHSRFSYDLHLNVAAFVNSIQSLRDENKGPMEFSQSVKSALKESVSSFSMTLLIFRMLAANGETLEINGNQWIVHLQEAAHTLSWLQEESLLQLGEDGSRLSLLLLTIAEATTRDCNPDERIECAQLLRECATDHDARVLAASLRACRAAFLDWFSKHTIPFLTTLPDRICLLLQESGGNAEHLIVPTVKDTLSATARLVRPEWTPITPAHLLPLVHTLQAFEWAQDYFFCSLMEQSHGSSLLLDLAVRSTNVSVQQDIILFLSQHSTRLRQASLQVSRDHVQLVFSLLPSLCGQSDTELHRLSTSMLEKAVRKHDTMYLKATLVVLKTMIMYKPAAVSFAEMGGLQSLYIIMSSSLAGHAVVELAIELCCCLTAHSDNVGRDTVLPLVKMLFLLTDARRNASITRLSFLALEQCVSLAAPVFSYGLTELARSNILLWRSRGENELVVEEADQVLRILYSIHHERSRRIARKHEVSKSSDNSITSEPLQQREDDVNEIGRLVCAYCQIVECQPPSNDSSAQRYYINMLTSEKTIGETPYQYLQLRHALNELRNRLDDVTVLDDDELMASVVPAVCKIIIFHCHPTETVCISMEVLSRITFLRPKSLTMHEEVDACGLLSACRLHLSSSLPFAIFLSSFCENIMLEVRGNADRLLSPVVRVILSLLRHQYHDYDVTRSSVFTLSHILSSAPLSDADTKSINILSLLNQVFHHHAHDISLLWYCLGCMDPVASKLGFYSADTLLESSNVLLSVVSAHSDHSFIVEKALRMLRCTMQHLSPVETLSLIDCGAIRTLLDAVANHASDEAIIKECFPQLLVLLHNNRNSLIMTGEMIARSAHVKVAKACELLINNAEVCGTGMEVLLSMLEIGAPVSDEQSTNSSGSRRDNSVLDDLLQADILQTLLRMAHNYTHHKKQPVLGLLLELLCELTADLYAREQFVRLRGLHVMREVLAAVETDNVLVESALDCLVNVACSPQSQLQWPKEMALELLHLGDRLHERGAPSDCVEKVIGILTRLAVSESTSNQLSKDGAHVILQLVSLVDNERYLEMALFGLLSQLSFVASNIPILVASDAIAITLERLCINLHDDSLLQCNLSLLHTMLLTSDCSTASVDPKMTLMMQLILDESSRSSRVRQLAQSLLDELTIQRQLPDQVAVAPVEPITPKLGVAPVVPVESREPEQVQQTPEQSENTRVALYQQRLRQGAVFRVRRDPKQRKREKIYICLADSSDYLIMRTLVTEPPIVERVFVSQLEVLPNTDAEPSSRRKPNLPLGLSVPSLVRTTSRTQCIFHVLIKKELVSLEATSATERQEWETMLQWLVQTSTARTVPRLKTLPYQ